MIDEEVAAAHRATNQRTVRDLVAIYEQMNALDSPSRTSRPVSSSQWPLDAPTSGQESHSPSRLPSLTRGGLPLTYEDGQMAE